METSCICIKLTDRTGVHTGGERGAWIGLDCERFWDFLIGRHFAIETNHDHATRQKCWPDHTKLTGPVKAFWPDKSLRTTYDELLVKGSRLAFSHSDA